MENNQNDKKINDVLFDPYTERQKKLSQPIKRKVIVKSKRNVVVSIFLTIIIICLSVVAAASIIAFTTDFMGIGGSTSDITFEVNDGDTANEVINKLSDRGIITNTTFFKLYLKIAGKDLTFKSGTHLLTNAMTYSDIINQLSSNSAKPLNQTVTLTFVEGISLNQAALMFEENNVCSAKDFLTAFNKEIGVYDFEEFVEDKTLKFNKFEGYMFPDTYDFFVESNPEQVVTRLRQVFSQKIYSKYYTKALESNLSFDEIITLASIIQAEAGNLEDMKLVSSVLHNRLKNSGTYPKLQSDPTTNFAQDIIIPNSTTVNQDMVNAYDTYVGNGLPPGAICNPGESAIIAALEPAESDYYYFCADLNTKEIYYAKTLEEHNDNLYKANLK